jgi:CheY-like chemotaxis protein
MDSETRATAQGKHVLVVNDTQEILELFTDILGEFGVETTTMSYAPRELDRVRAVDPDLIILDFVFGEKELLGWQLLQKLKMDRALATVPVIVCSAAIRTLHELQGYLTEHGVVIVVKPFTVDQLEEAVVKALALSGTTGPSRSGAVQALGERSSESGGG